MQNLSWDERISMLSANPEAATLNDISRMASELMEYKIERDSTEHDSLEEYTKSMKPVYDFLNETFEV